MRRRRASDAWFLDGVSHDEGLLGELYRLVRGECEYLGIPALECERYAAHIVAALVDHLGGQRRYFPRGQGVKQLIRDALILTDCRAGVPVPKIASSYGMTESRVYQILHRHGVEFRGSSA